MIKPTDLKWRELATWGEANSSVSCTLRERTVGIAVVSAHGQPWRSCAMTIAASVPDFATICALDHSACRPGELA
jgi:hypothetical protein